ncbi:MAG: class I tRNA ligase family protein [bacterium]
MNPESKEYDHKKIESKWQKEWEDKGAFKAITGSDKPKKYALSMFPYPSGAGLHVGHPRGYIANDVYARLMRMKGFNVLHPMGFDSFGLPAEQYAIKTGNNPKVFTDELVKQYRKQLDIIGFGYDWERQVATHRPEYYKWTQWIFLKLYGSWYNKATDKAEPIEHLIEIFNTNGNESVDAVCDNDTKIVTADEWKDMSKLEKNNLLMKYRLAYEGFSEVNWCPELGTVLANDEIIDGPNGTPVSERGGFPVEKKTLRQWFLRITAYSDRLLSGLETIDWPSHIKEIQKNWIGKSDGSVVTFAVSRTDADSTRTVAEGIQVFTTRVDTLFGVTYVVIAPEHELVQKLLDLVSNKDEVVKYIEEVKNKTTEDRTAENKEKTGVPLKGVTAINPANGEEVPVWIADYVLASYGTGAVMAVPAHDDRDFAFAKKYNLKIKHVIAEEKVSDSGPLKFRPEEPIIKRNVIRAVVKHWSEDKYLILNWKDHNWNTFISGGVENEEDLIESAKREVEEETGYFNLKFIKEIGSPFKVKFYAPHKNQNREDIQQGLYFELIDNEQKEVNEDEKTKHSFGWVEKSNIAETVKDGIIDSVLWQRIQSDNFVSVDDGVLINSTYLPSNDLGAGTIIEIPDGKFVFQIRDKNTKHNPEMIACFGGHREAGENAVDTIIREIKEELEIDVNKSDLSFVGNIPSKNEEGKFIAMFSLKLDKVPKKTKEGDGIVVYDFEQTIANPKVTDFTKDVLDIYLKKGGSRIVFDGLSSEEARKEITKAVGGKFVTKYKMRDAVFARQRYWGEPIPLIHEKDGTVTALSEKDLPLELPDVKSYAPTGNAESPLSSVSDWVEKGYETNTMPGWAGSSWYFLRYMDPQNENEFASNDALKYWGQVDMYVGGAEHATGHLLYSRFWNKFLHDLNLVPNEEPFKVLRNQGMILGADHKKMSKRWGNVVNPDDVVNTFGADTLRVFEMFIGPFESQLPWSTDGIVGSRRFVERVWRLQEKIVEKDFENKLYENTLHKTIKKVGEDIESFNFNTAISAMMICLNEMEKSENVYRGDFEKFIKILSPFAPHITEEIWSMFGNKNIIQDSLWPEYDPEKLTTSTVTIMVQVNGKIRGELNVLKDMDEKAVLDLAKGSESVAKWLAGGEIIKVVFVPNRLINIVVKTTS